MVNNRHQFDHQPDDHDEQVEALARELGIVCSNNPYGVVLHALILLMADVAVRSPLCRHMFFGVVAEELMGNIMQMEADSDDRADPDPNQIN